MLTRDSTLPAPAPPNRLSAAEQQAAVVAAMPKVRLEVLRLAGPAADPDAVDDLLSDAYQAACRCAALFDPAGPASFVTACVAYVRKRVTGSIADAAARRARIPVDRHAAPDELPVTHNEGADTSPPTIAGIDPAMESALDGMTPLMREVVRLIVGSGLRPDQAALQLGIDVKTVKLVARKAAAAAARHASRN